MAGSGVRNLGQRIFGSVPAPDDCFPGFWLNLRMIGMKLNRGWHCGVDLDLLLL